MYNEVSHFNDKDYFTDEQLESAKALLEADDLYSREKLSDYTHTLSFWWASTGLDYFRGYLPRLRATSRADISRYITTYIQGKPHIGLALMSNEAQNQAQNPTARVNGSMNKIYKRSSKQNHGCSRSISDVAAYLDSLSLAASEAFACHATRQSDRRRRLFAASSPSRLRWSASLTLMA